MKIIISIVFFFCVHAQLRAQKDSDPSYNPKLADSLRKVIQRTDNDSTKALNMILLSWAIEGDRADSALDIAKQAYEFSKRKNIKIYQVRALRAVGYNQKSMGDYAESLKTFFLALEILGKPSDEESNILPNAGGHKLSKWSLEEYAEVLRFMGHLHGAVGNRTEELIKYKKALKIHEAMNRESLIANTNWNIADVLVETNRLDSAIIMAQKSLSYYEKKDVAFYIKTYLSEVYNIIGKAYFKSKKYQLAEPVFLKAEEANIKYGNQRNLTKTQLNLAELYYEKQEFESSLEYASKARYTAQEVGLTDYIARSYAALAVSFQALNRQDSGYYYLKLAAPLIDSLNKVEKNNLIRYQNALFAENQKLQKLEKEKTAAQNRIRIIFLLGVLVFILLTALLLYRNIRQKQKANKVLESTLTNLKSTQSQLIQSEKMASLGELTAGIAHEIQNPLNFVNNFSEVSKELLDEIKEELEKGNLEDAKEIMNDVIQNLEKINHHGKRADGIVKGMLQHSRSSSGTKEPTDINVLAEEYLRLAYHGLRAKDKSFNASMKTEFDNSIEKINVIPQDIGRVILNLITNAFYAVSTVASAKVDSGYEPTVTITTSSIQPPFPNESGQVGGRSIQIKVADNGGGIPQKVLEKIFQPFFTTKPTGQGTGLGLSLAYDIIKAHGGDIIVNTKENEGTEFSITLPG